MLGLGVLLALSPSSPAGLNRLLFGDILGVGTTDLILAGALSVVLIVVLGVLHWSLAVVAFDRLNARALGRSPAAVDVALAVLLAAALLVAVQGLGNLLVIAVLVGPAACARALTRRMPSMMAAASAIAVLAGAGGVYLSYYARTAAGASIAAVIVAAYAVILAASALHRRRRVPAPA
jgi:ABC-type Mn2+/Zn2+ transport system permease subunit